MLNINEIKFGNEKSAEIFSDIAQRAAKHIKTNKNLNKQHSYVSFMMN